MGETFRKNYFILRCKVNKIVFNLHRFFSRGITGFSTLPLRIESKSKSLGDGFRFNGGNFLSEAYD